MMSALWVSKTGLSAQDMALHTISNNLANVSTIGFKRDRAVFEDLLYQVLQQPGAQSSQDTTLPSGLQLGTGVRIAGTQKMFGIGSMQTTEAPLDLAVEGRGFFQITMPDGSIGYTRDGQFRMDQDGQIVNSQGHPLEPVISIPEDAETITIGVDGTVSVMTKGNPAATQVGTVEIVNFVNPAGLQANGGNLFAETPASGSPQSGTAGTNGLGYILQGTLETSNVSVVEELVNMVSVQRAYEMNSKVVSTSDQMLQYLTQNV
jgi:flagellar basal-body rod protein FlgG